MQEKTPFVLLTNENRELKLKRVLLKDRAADLIRDHIVMGHLPPGTRLVEREVAKILGMSRIPVRDALLELEKEGLVIVKSGVRCVIELSENDIRELYQARVILEKAAVELATQNTSPENRKALSMKLQEMKEAFDRKDTRAFIKNDLETHVLIWCQSNNNRLMNMLKSIVGPIFMSMATNAGYYPWKETVEHHQDLVTAINSGDTRRSIKSIERHLNSALHRSLSNRGDDAGGGPVRRGKAREPMGDGTWGEEIKTLNRRGHKGKKRGSGRKVEREKTFMATDKS